MRGRCQDAWGGEAFAVVPRPSAREERGGAEARGVWEANGLSELLFYLVQGMRNGMTPMNDPLFFPFKKSLGSFPHSLLSTGKLFQG